MNIVTTLHFRTISVTIAFLVLQHSAKYTLGQLDSNVNTLRYDGEVNIGKIILVFFFLYNKHILNFYLKKANKGQKTLK